MVSSRSSMHNSKCGLLNDICDVLSRLADGTVSAVRLSVHWYFQPFLLDYRKVAYAIGLWYVGLQLCDL